MTQNTQQSTIQIKHRYTGAVLFEGDFESLKLCVQAAVRSGADLRGANGCVQHLGRRAAAMSESNSTIGDELLDEARATIERWAGDLDDAGPEFQTLHMFASYLLQQRDQLLEALRELYAADAEFDKRRDGYNPLYATREQIDAYRAAENRRAVAQILAHAAIARAEGRSHG